MRTLDRRSGAKRGVTGAFGILVISMSASAIASPPLELIGSSLGGGGFNARSFGPSAASTYFNPALLPFADPSFALGTFVLNDAITITVGPRSPSVDVPEAALNNFNDGDRAVGTAPALPTAWLQNGCQRSAGQCVTDLAPRPRQAAGSSGNTNVYQEIGFVAHLFQRRLSLGFHSLVPLRSLVRAHSFFPDEREQFFTNSLHPELYSDRLTSMSMAFGAGSRITEWLSLGASVTMSLSTTATPTAYIGDSANLNGSLRQSAVTEAGAAFAPHFGAVVQPLDRLRATATVHTPQKMEIDTSTTTFLANGDRQEAPRHAVHNWLPWIASLGASYVVIRTDVHEWAVTATAQYEAWSQYENRQGERPLRDYDWIDTLNGALGLRYTYDGRFSTFLDGNYRPSPVPRQTGRTNYVDNDSFGIAAGVTYEIPLDDLGLKLRFGAHGQAHMLVDRSQVKLDPTSPALASRRYSQLVIDEWSDRAVDSRPQTIAAAQGLQTNNPGWPGFSSHGFLLGVGASVTVAY